VLPALLPRKFGKQRAQFAAVFAIGVVVHLVDRLGGLHRTPERQPRIEQLRVEQFGAERATEEGRQPLAGVGRGLGHGLAQQVHDPTGDRHVGFGDQLVLARIMVADQAYRDTGFGADLADRCALETMALQAGQGGLDQIGLAQFGQHAAEAGFLGHRGLSWVE